MTTFSDVETAYNALQTELEAVKTYLAGVPALLSTAAAGTASSADFDALISKIQTDTSSLSAATAAAPTEAPAPT
jgi:hypothetical protein